jgi:hypothetical protein
MFGAGVQHGEGKGGNVVVVLTTTGSLVVEERVG